VEVVGEVHRPGGAADALAVRCVTHPGIHGALHR
jgi:hypothetical protein